MVIRKIKIEEYEYIEPINMVSGATEPDIQFQLTDYEIPSGATGRVYVGRSDGTFEYTVATISGNTVTVAPTSSMFSVKGAGAIQVTLYVGNEVVKNFAVPVYVHADLADDSAEAGSDVTGVFRAAEEQALADFAEDAEAKAAEVIESIPADYTELTEDVAQLNEQIGDLSELETTVKTDLVSAINEAAQSGGSGGVGVPAVVRAAIYTLLSAAVYTETGLADEIALVEEWADTAATAISLNKSSLTMSGVTSETLIATLTPVDSTTPVVWSSSDTSVATVSSGTVTSVGNGSCTITATAGSVSATCSVAVSGITVSYSITNALTNVTNSNNATAISEGDDYSAVLTADIGYELGSVTITMGTTDITSTAYDDGTITIEDVSGNITITATGTKTSLIYSWDFTQSLTDAVSGVTATLLNSQSTPSNVPTRDSTGLHFTAAEQVLSLVTLDDLASKRIEIDVTSMDFKGTSSSHKRFLTTTNSDGTGGNALLVYRQSTGGWQMYNGNWRAYRDYAISGQTVPDTVNAISGKTIAISLDSSRHPTLMVDGTAVASISSYTASNNKRIMIGGNAVDSQSSGQQIYDCTISAIRIYEEAT